MIQPGGMIYSELELNTGIVSYFPSVFNDDTADYVQSKINLNVGVNSLDFLPYKFKEI
jgi:hypothetical protein